MTEGPEVITTVAPLVAWLERGCKPREQWRVGTEHEKFGFRPCDLTPIPYDGPDGIRAVFEALVARFGWQPILEGGNPIGLQSGAASVTLEPGGQVELSGAPVETIHETQDEINQHLDQLAAVCRDLHIAFVGVGAQPKWPFERIPWMPKGRYRVMRAYLPRHGPLSLDMMCRTATVQANLDFASERDMAAKLRLGLALQPLVTALFANSPFLDGRPCGFLSYRGQVWRHTDPDRCGWLPFAFQPGFGFESYVQWALDVPMFFFYRGGAYQDAGGVPFRRFLEGRHPARPGEYPTLADWELHLSTLFPDVRLKRFLEMRGADAGNSATLCALPALWKGLLHDDDALAAAWERVAGWSLEERERIWQVVPRLGLETPIPGGTLDSLARHVLEIARGSLHRQGCKNADGCDESIYLNPLFDTIERGQTPAHRLLAAYHQRWGGNVDPLFREEEFETFIGRCS